MKIYSVFIYFLLFDNSSSFSFEIISNILEHPKHHKATTKPITLNQPIATIIGGKSFADSNPIIEEFRSKYGTTRDLSAKQTRELYHFLLPKNLLETHYSDSDELFEAASKAIDIRNSAKAYARERAYIPVLLFSLLFEFTRRSKKTNIDIWDKYADKLGINGFQLEKAVDYPELCQLVLQKSCTTNEFINNLVNT